MELFTETKKDLEQTTEQLKITTNHLEKTAEVLQETEENLCQTTQDRNEQRHLVMEHVTNEDKLYGQANDVSNSCDFVISFTVLIYAPIEIWSNKQYVF